jgi:hypothetical protein
LTQIPVFVDTSMQRWVRPGFGMKKSVGPCPSGSITLTNPTSSFGLLFSGNPVGCFELKNGNDGASEKCFWLMPNWVGNSLGSALQQDAIHH